MKRKVSIGLAVAFATLGMLRVAGAALLLGDNFDSYTAGNLVGQGGWTITGTSVTNPIAVTTTNAVSSPNAVSLTNNGQDAFKAFTTPLTKVDGNAIFVGFDLNVSSAQAVNSGDYFAHLSDPAGTTSNFYDRMFVQSSGAGYILGVAGSTNSAPGAGNFGSTVLNFGQTYHIAETWNFVAGAANDTFSLYVNPTDTSVEANNTPYASLGWGSTAAEPAATISAFNFRQGSSTQASSETVDDVAVGTSFSDVATAGVVPEPSTVALLGIFGIFGYCRRRRA